jgi:hypothetical protein
MSLEAKSQALKDIVAKYDTQYFLGNLSGLCMHIAKGTARDQLGKLSSPLRQLYFMAGLMMSSNPSKGVEIQYSHVEWDAMVDLLNDIENEYENLFFPEKPENVDEQWSHIRGVAMPSFLSYFNQGPLNYEEQVINWTRDLYTPMDSLIEQKTGIKTEDFIRFYEKLDLLNQNNFQGHTTNKDLLRPNWKDYTKIQMGVADGVPDFLKEIGEKKAHLHSFIYDHGIIDRFFAHELVTPELPIVKVLIILNMLDTNRSQTDYLYYTATKPGNPLYEKPIVDIGDGLFQVFEVKQVMHAIENLLERICTGTTENSTKYVEKKGKLLEQRIVELFTQFFKNDITVHRGYYIDECEQDILILWKNFAFIIEAKGYALHEPFRNPDKAFIRIKNDFNACIGYGYDQTRRVEKKFVQRVPLKVTDKNGNPVSEIDTTKFERSFSIIVNLDSFGQIQTDLSTLLIRENKSDVFPWAIRLDDLEVFVLTLIAQKSEPTELVKFLMMRETMHGKLICSDELEICGGYLIGKLTQEVVDKNNTILTTPDLPQVFDDQYYKVMGFKNEKYLHEKTSGKFIFF